VLKGKHVLLVDDSIVRGTTGKNLIWLVNKHAARVHLLVTCPPIKHPCFYGIDFPLKSELIATKKSVEGIRKQMGLDELTFQTLQGLREAIGVEGLCTACLTGEYPTLVTKKDKGKLARERTNERGHD
jgi:amidophosphoribosyltransferase